MTQEQIDIDRFGHRCRRYLETRPETEPARLWGVSVDEMPEASLRDAVRVLADILAQERGTASFFNAVAKVKT